MSLTTPEMVGKLQATLHDKAKRSPDYRFYLLYDKVHRADVLAFAYVCCRHNAGAPGADGQTFDDIEQYGRDRWLDELAEELRKKTYQPQAVRRVWIPKPDGKRRPLGIPTIRDRRHGRIEGTAMIRPSTSINNSPRGGSLRPCRVQMAAVLVLEPIFETDLPPEQYAYRKGRSALDAVSVVNEWLHRGYTEVVDADLSG